MDISDATLQNWRRLNVDGSTRLCHRANKSRSEKRIYPLEYIEHRESIEFADLILNLCAANEILRSQAIFTLAVRFLEQKGILQLPHVRKVLAEGRGQEHSLLRSLDIPENEVDILGFIYQCLLNEGEKSVAGSYYTPFSVASEMTACSDYSSEKTFCDPCCGSGIFLLSIPVDHPDRLWGCDKDPLAVFITKVNLLCKFKDIVFFPQIFCCDYLEENSASGSVLFEQCFDIIATNPPWGAEKNRKKIRGESFALFFKKAVSQLKTNGIVSFLLPEAVLRIKAHAELRAFILQKRLKKIVLHKGAFTGVMTGYVSVQVRNASPEEFFELQDGERGIKCSIKEVLSRKDFLFSFLSEEDRQILQKVQKQKVFFLNSDGFALGIVTGDNRGKIREHCADGMERIFTGREVGRYLLKPAVKFLHYDRKSFQQAAPEKYYRAPEKLVYRFISDQLVFAYDDTGSLVLNSANVLIPEIPGMSIKTVLAFLNSKFLRYYYSVVFGDIKILKGNLLQLPFPEISSENAARIDHFVDMILSGSDTGDEALQSLIYKNYQLSEKEIAYIEQKIYDFEVKNTKK